MHSAQIGDCFDNGGTFAQPMLQPAPCNGNFMVVRKLLGTIDHSGCADAPNDDYNVDNSADNIVLCLTYLHGSNGAYHADPGTCVFGQNVQGARWTMQACTVDTFTVLKRIVGNTDKSQCDGLPGWDDTLTISTSWDQLNVLLCLAMNFPPEGRVALDTCMLRTPGTPKATFQPVDCSVANVLITGRIYKFSASGYCGTNGWTSWRSAEFQNLAYTTCFRAYP